MQNDCNTNFTPFPTWLKQSPQVKGHGGGKLRVLAERERENFSARKLQVAGSAPPAEEKQEVRRMLRILLCRERSFLVFDILGSGGVVVVEEIWGKSS